MRRLMLLAAAGAAITLTAPARAQTFIEPHYFAEVAASGFARPVHMQFIGHNDFFVLEQWTGRVRRVVGGVITGTVLQLPVATEGEQGLLGITLHPDFHQNGLVYIYWSRAAALGSPWLDNRVERFHWNGTVLTYESTIRVFPFDPNQNNPPWHHGGVIRIGPDNKLYIGTGDLNRGYFGSMATIEQNRSPTGIAAVGGVHRLNLDGTIPFDNPFVFHADDRIRSYFAYGIRNSYGMNFDPLTGRLWQTDNGPENWDEVSMVESGMNGGWLKIMGPDERNAQYAQNGFTSFNAKDLIYLPGAFYADPAFSWFRCIGATGIVFLEGRKFRPEERNQALIAGVNFPELFLFEMNAARDAFVLTGAVADKVADTDAERNLNAVGTGFGRPTYLGIGPDGYLYVVNVQGGLVYRVRPNVEEIVPDSFSIFRGILVSGSLASLQDSDDDRLSVRPGLVLSSSEDPVQVVVTGRATLPNPTEIRFRLEAHASATNIQQRIELFNYVTQSYETLDTRAATTSDSIVTVNVTSNPTRFINSVNREMRARVAYRQVGPVLAFPWQTRIDQTAWIQVK